MSDHSLECPVCLEQPNSIPIFQCQNGHMICKDCRLRLTRAKCPVCRVDFGTTTIRCLVAENFIAGKVRLSTAVTPKPPLIRPTVFGTKTVTPRLMCITTKPAFEGKSLEELRLEYSILHGKKKN